MKTNSEKNTNTFVALEDSKDSQFFYREWRKINSESTIYVVLESTLNVGKIIGFVNFEHAVVQLTNQSEKIIVLNLTSPGIALFHTLEKAVAYRLSQRGG